jgi:hypothetical protein
MASESWLSPMNRAIWVKAFRNRDKKVKLRNGREFEIRYGIQHRFKASEEVEENAFVKPVKGFAPCGYFRMSKVTDEQWITEQDKTRDNENLYVTLLNEFVRSREPGVAVREEWSEQLGDRLNTTIRQGFATAIVQGRREKRVPKSVEVMTIDGSVYLLREEN